METLWTIAGTGLLCLALTWIPQGKVSTTAKARVERERVSFLNMFLLLVWGTIIIGHPRARRDVFPVAPVPRPRRDRLYRAVCPHLLRRERRQWPPPIQAPWSTGALAG